MKDDNNEKKGKKMIDDFIDDFIKEILENASKRILKEALRKVGPWWNYYSAMLNCKWRDYRDSILEIDKYRCILNSSKNMSVLNTFVQPMVTLNYPDPVQYYNWELNDPFPDDTIRAEKFENLANFDRNKIVIVGGPGSGKTILLKWLLIQTVLEEKKRIPVYIKLSNYNGREIDGIRIDNIQDLIIASLRYHGFDVTWEQVEPWLIEGKFIFFMDGYDEINGEIQYCGQTTNRRMEFFNELQNMIGRYGNGTNKNYFIVSSRICDDFKCIDGMVCYSVCPFPRSYAVEQIARFPNDLLNDSEDHKMAFIKSLQRKEYPDGRKDRYTEYQVFASNPLFLVFLYKISLDSRKEPSETFKIFEEILDTLFDEKGRYKFPGERTSRMYKTKLSKTDFEKVLSVYCYMCCLTGKCGSVSKGEFKDRVEKNKHAAAFEAYLKDVPEFDSDDILEDLTENVGLFSKSSDGKYDFIHYLFYEYYAMIFMYRIQDGDSLNSSKNLFIKKQAYFATTSEIFFMLFEKATGLFEQTVLYPQLVRFENDLKNSLKREVILNDYYETLIPNIVVNCRRNTLEFGVLNSSEYREDNFLVASADFYIRRDRQRNAISPYDEFEQHFITGVKSRKNLQNFDGKIQIEIQEIFKDDELLSSFENCWVGKRVRTLFDKKSEIEAEINKMKNLLEERYPSY